MLTSQHLFEVKKKHEPFSVLICSFSHLAVVDSFIAQATDDRRSSTVREVHYWFWDSLAYPAIEATASRVKAYFIDPDEPSTSFDKGSEEPFENLPVLLDVFSPEVDTRLACLHIAVLEKLL